MNALVSLIQRRVGLCMLAIGVLLLGGFAYFQLPVAALPTVDFPTIAVTATLSGANAETMASSVATPLERAFAAVPQVTSMTSSSAAGKTTVILQFDLNRNIDGAAGDVQAALSAAKSQLPKTMTTDPTFHKINPAEATVLTLAVTSPTRTLPELNLYADNYLAQRLSQLPGVGQVDFHGQQTPAMRIQIDPDALAARGLTLEDVRSIVGISTLDQPKGNLDGPARSVTLATSDQLLDPRPTATRSSPIKAACRSRSATSVASWPPPKTPSSRRASMASRPCWWTSTSRPASTCCRPSTASRAACRS